MEKDRMKTCLFPSLTCVLTVLVVLVTSANASMAQEEKGPEEKLTAEQTKFFEAKIRPIQFRLN